MQSFYCAWTISAILLLALAAMAGRVSRAKSLVGILIDDRGRYSLNRLQLVMWTILILSAFLGIASMSAGFNLPQIPANYLPLLGISAGTAVLAGAVKDSKNVSGAVVQSKGAFAVDPATKARVSVQSLAAGAASEAISPHFAQVFLEEEGQAADLVVSVTKFQNFIFTVALGIWFVAATIRLKDPGFPALPDNVLWLLGISHATYVGGKVPTKA